MINIFKVLFAIITACTLMACSGHHESEAIPAPKKEALTIEQIEELHEGIMDKSSTQYATLRGESLSLVPTPPRMMPQLNEDIRQVRNYPEQPPVIPHKIEDYQVDRKHNQCMDCHDRRAIGDSQAPMVSVSHFTSRDGQVLASISPRRYFCNQCHVPQLDVGTLIDNTFTDVEDIIKAGEE